MGEPSTVQGQTRTRSPNPTLQCLEAERLVNVFVGLGSSQY